LNGKTEYVNSDWKRVEKDYEYYVLKKVEMWIG
jgi:hypothetical protein